MNAVKLQKEIKRYEFRDRHGRKLEDCGPFKKLVELAEKQEHWRAVVEVPDARAIIKLVDEIVEKSPFPMMRRHNLIKANAYLKKKINELFPKKDRSQKTKRAARHTSP
jgi:hypothetical protein